MEREICSSRQGGVVSVNFPDPENARGRAPIAFGLAQTFLVLTSDATSPGQAAFPKEDRAGRAGWLPSAGTVPLETLQRSPHRVPIRSDSDKQLLAVIRNARGTGTAGKLKQG